MSDKVPKSIRLMASKILIKEAMRRGISCRHINPYQKKEPLLELSKNNHFEYILWQKGSKLSFTSDYITQNKQVTKYFLKKKRISISESGLFSSEDIDGIKIFAGKIGYPLVIKPYNGSKGDFIFLGVEDWSHCVNIIKENFSKKQYIILEKEFFGQEYRFMATKNKVLGVIRREPANVTGDGFNNIKELINIKNFSKNGEKHLRRFFKIVIDDNVKNKLKSQNLSINSVLDKGRKIFLRDTSNVSTGGDSIDVTEKVHPGWNKLAISVINSIPGLPWGGIDILIKGNISEKPSEEKYVVIEVNSNPGILSHYFPCTGKRREIVKGFLDVLFPETRT